MSDPIEVTSLREAVAADRMSPPVGRCSPERYPHDPLCECSECFARRHDRRRGQLFVTPFLPWSERSREQQEPTAELKYGGVTIELTLSFVHQLWQSVDGRADASMATFLDALRTIERRMHDDADARRAALPLEIEPAGTAKDIARVTVR